MTFDDFQTEWMTTIHAAWPEIVLPGSGIDSNFFTGMQALKQNLVTMMDAGSVPFPACMLSFGDWILAPDWTIDAPVRWAPITVFYLDCEGNGASQNSVFAKLLALSEYTQAHPGFTTFTEVLPPSLYSADTSVLNSVLPVESGVRAFGGFCAWQTSIMPKFA